MTGAVISVVSFFNSANLGDLLIAEQLVRRSGQFGAVRPISFSGDPLTLVSPDAYRQEPPVDTPSSSLDGWKSRALASSPALHMYRRNWQRRGVEQQLVKTFAESDVVVIGGGNMLFDLDPWTHSAENFRYFAKLAKQAGVPAVGMALGIGPFATARQLRAASLALDMCYVVTFRDAQSKALYEQFGHRPARLSVDPVLLLPARLLPRHPSTGDVAFNATDPRFLAGTSPDARKRASDSVFDLAQRLLERGHRLRLFSTDAADLTYLQDLRRRLSSPQCSLELLSGFDSLLGIYRDSDVVVAGRMHALIVAATQNRPVVGLAWQQKVRSFFAILNRPGQVFDVENFAVPHVADLIRTMLGDPESFLTSPRAVPGVLEGGQVDDRTIAQALGLVA